MCLHITANSCHTNDGIESPKPGVYVVKDLANAITKTATRNRIMHIV